MIVVFLGPPGAGKGTQASRVAAKYGLPQVSTGDMLRDAAASGTEFGQRVKAIMDSGGLVDDDTMLRVVEERLARPDAQSGVVLDGYPRTRGQALALDELLRSSDRGAVDVVFFLDVAEEILVERLSRRRACSACNANYHLTFNAPGTESVCDRCGNPLTQRDDDREEVILDRLHNYREQTEPLVDWYAGRNLLVRIDGKPDIDRVFGDIDAAMVEAVTL